MCAPSAVGEGFIRGLGATEAGFQLVQGIDGSREHDGGGPGRGLGVTGPGRVDDRDLVGSPSGPGVLIVEADEYVIACPALQPRGQLDVV